MSDKLIQDLNLSELPESQQNEVQLLLPHFMKAMLHKLGGKFNLSVKDAEMLGAYQMNIRVYPGTKTARLELQRRVKKPVDH